MLGKQGARWKVKADKTDNIFIDYLCRKHLPSIVLHNQESLTRAYKKKKKKSALRAKIQKEMEIKWKKEKEKEEAKTSYDLMKQPKGCMLINKCSSNYDTN